MKTNPTAKKMTELRAQGHKIKVTHFRVTDRGIMTTREIDEEKALDKANRDAPMSEKQLMQNLPVISPCGGRVTVEIETPEGLNIHALSECSMLDNFKRKIGTAIAFGRALKELERQRKATTS